MSHSRLLYDPETGDEFPSQCNGDWSGDLRITIAEEHRERFLEDDAAGPGTVVLKIPTCWMLQVLDERLGDELVGAIEDRERGELLRLVLAARGVALPSMADHPSNEDRMERVRQDVREGKLPDGYPPRDMDPFPVRSKVENLRNKYGIKGPIPETVPYCIVLPVQDEIAEETGQSLEELEQDGGLRADILVKAVLGRDEMEVAEIIDALRVMAEGDIPAVGENFPALGTRCGDCGRPQYLTPSGATCGAHGGAPPEEEGE